MIGCEIIPGRAEHFTQRRKVLEGAKKRKLLFFASLCALASLREIVYFFTAAPVGTYAPPANPIALMSAPEDLCIVLFNCMIGGENNYTFSLRLCNQKTIKGVVMARGQLSNRERVSVGN